MKTFLKFIFMALLLGNASAQPVLEDWVARYNGPSSEPDEAAKLAVDNLGNVFVTGKSRWGDLDYLTVKYNTNGVQQWASRYNSNGNGDDYAVSLVLDASGNVYVTGSSFVYLYDYMTVCYNTSGVQQWGMRWSQSNTNDYAFAIGIYNNALIYIAGESNGDFGLVRYTTAGYQNWSATYYYTLNWESPSSLAIDNNGNFYAAGYGDYGTGNDYLILKYNQTPTFQWAGEYNGPANGNDKVRASVTDNSGNIYATGLSWGGGTLYDIATIKYNSSGTQQWAARYNGTGNASDEGYAIAVDQYGNVYVTGTSVGAGTDFDFITIKYNTNGAQQWVARYDGSNLGDGASAMVLDNSGNIYVTGMSNGGSGFDYLTVKYTNNGDIVWDVTYDGPAGQHDEAVSIALDAQRNVYVTGRSTGNGTGFDYCTIKYSQPIGIEPISSEIPSEFKLNQNYPNPFNPTTNVRFEIPELRYVTLKIYDILGREVTTLVNELLKPGIYEVEWDASNYPSGVYYYTLNAGDYKNSKRMVLVK